jgi:predicted ArsR family transcriptional regulator
LTSLKLDLANLWLPDSAKRKELGSIATATNKVLVGLLEESKHGEAETMKIDTPTGSIEDMRAAIARNHRRLVEALADELGTDEARRLSREALFRVGVSLGEKARTSLGVGDDPTDLLKAARVLYGILGIQFTARGGPGNYSLEIHSCALSRQYTEQTCDSLSAVDEGVLRGFNPAAEMHFTQKMTSGCSTCIALIGIKRVVG